MEPLYLTCLVIGGTVLVCQFVMAVMGLTGDGDSFDADVDMDVPADGLGHHGDVGDPHGSTWLFGVLSFKTIVAALAFFGAAGMAATKSGQGQLLSLVIATGAGVVAVYVVHWAMKSLHKLTSDGTERISGAVGKAGTVYLTIPPGRSGRGKIHMTLQSRLVEYQAMTSANERIPTGATITVVGVLGSDIVEVEPVQQTATVA